jgi:hypothetical protein
MRLKRSLALAGIGCGPAVTAYVLPLAIGYQPSIAIVAWPLIAGTMAAVLLSRKICR